MVKLLELVSKFLQKLVSGHPRRVFALICPYLVRAPVIEPTPSSSRLTTTLVPRIGVRLLKK